MKRFISALIFILSTIVISNVYAQDTPLLEYAFPTRDGLISYSEVITLKDSTSASEIQKSIKLWISSTHKSTDAVIEIDKLGLITLKSFISHLAPSL